MFLLSLLFFVLIVISSLFFLALGLPGNWLLLAGTLIAVAISPKAAVTLATVLTLSAFCVAAEVLEWFCGVVGAKRYGVSKAGVWGAILGGFGGAFLLGSVIPIVGAVPGGFLGTFLGAYIAELTQGQSREQALKLGVGAFIARMTAVAVKIGVTFAMASIGFFLLF